MKIVFLGLSITSSWGNGHATTYRGLVRSLNEQGHETLFLERDLPWYAGNRDMPEPPFGTTCLYASVDELKDRFADAVRSADAVIVGSYVPDGVTVADWATNMAKGVTAFYDIDTPVTLAKLEEGSCEYLSPELIPRFDLYLSFTGGPTLNRLEREFGAKRALPLYCSFDPSLYYPEPETPLRWDLGYMGTYSDDRQPVLERLLIEPARRIPEQQFVVAGPQYPDEITWLPNIERIIHLSPDKHRAFYCAQRFTLNITRENMVRAGYAPSVRLFEAAACAVPVISDWWEGLDTFFVPEQEILIARSSDAVCDYLRYTSEADRAAMGVAARQRVQQAHTAPHRAQELATYLQNL
ncbi:MAG: glycosyltransferase [Armatimonadaceae bacterium]